MASVIPLKLIFDIFVAIIFILFWIANFIVLYHLTRFGIGVQPKRFAAIFFFGSIILFCVSILLYANLDINAILKIL